MNIRNRAIVAALLLGNTLKLAQRAYAQECGKHDDPSGAPLPQCPQESQSSSSSTADDYTGYILAACAGLMVLCCVCCCVMACCSSPDPRRNANEENQVELEQVGGQDGPDLDELDQRDREGIQRLEGVMIEYLQQHPEEFRQVANVVNEMREQYAEEANQPLPNNLLQQVEGIANRAIVYAGAPNQLPLPGAIQDSSPEGVSSSVSSSTVHMSQLGSMKISTDHSSSSVSSASSSSEGHHPPGGVRMPQGQSQQAENKYNIEISNTNKGP